MKDSQNKKILRYLLSGKGLTPMCALSRFKCYRLAARVADLKNMGYDITTVMQYKKNGVKFAKYYIFS